MWFEVIIRALVPVQKPQTILRSNASILTSLIQVTRRIACNFFNLFSVSYAPGRDSEVGDARRNSSKNQSKHNTAENTIMHTDLKGTG